MEMYKDPKENPNLIMDHFVKPDDLRSSQEKGRELGK
jgi:hypothetical protein